jgi:hypothetical protein
MTDDLTKEEISEITGIPTGKSSGKVEPHVEYGIYMGLFENMSKQSGKYKLKRTKLGSIVKREDIGLHEEVTQLLFHIRITSPSTGALLWSHIFRNILPRYSDGVSFLVLEDELKKLPTFSSIKTINIGPFYTTYKKSFGAVKLLSKTKEKIKLIPQIFQNELLYVYGYCLVYEWEQVFSGYSEITAEQLSSLRFSSAFGLSDSEAFYILEKLSEKRLILINGQLSPFTIIKNVSSDAIVEKAYSLLC